MAVKTETFHIAVCDVCGIEFDEFSEAWHWDGSPESALAQIRCAEPHTDWRIVGVDVVVCPTGDRAHDQVRGYETPRRLRPTRDAVIVRFDDLDWVADALGATVIATEEAA